MAGVERGKPPATATLGLAPFDPSHPKRCFSAERAGLGTWVRKAAGTRAEATIGDAPARGQKILELVLLISRDMTIYLRQRHA